MYKGPFNWWVQSVMPVVFDDSLSYYEVLAKLTKYIEGLTGDVDQIEKILATIEGIEDITEFTKFLETIKTEIGNLDNLQTANKDDLVSAINEIALKANNAYVKPSGGIPESDLSQEVQDKLNRTVDATKYIINNRELKAAPSNNSPADLGLGTYSVPQGGIPWDTLSQDVQDRINAGGGGTGGTTDYTDLNNKPQINGHTLNAGNNTADSLGIGTYNKPSTGIPESDLSEEVQEKLNTSGGIADSETSFVATRDYEAGELIYINGVLYKTKYKILSGTNLIPGNNIEVTDISAEIERINNDIDALQSGSGPDSWNLKANVKNNSAEIYTRFFEYFNAIGGENYLFIITPGTDNSYYQLGIFKKDGTAVHYESVNQSPDEQNQFRFTFTPTDTGEYYCGVRKWRDENVRSVNISVSLEYTQSQGISELWSQVNSASQLEPRVGALETLVEKHQSSIEDLDEDVTDLKSALNNVDVAVFADGENIINSKKIHYNNNTAVVNNNDGTYTVGTSDYGRTLFSGRLTLEAGVYYLYGVPSEGYSFLSTDGTSANAFVKNATSNGVPVLITTTTVCFIGFSVEPAPSASFTLAPYLKKSYAKSTIPVLTNIVEQNSRINNNANILNNYDIVYTPNKYWANGSYYGNEDYSVFEINLKEGVTYTFGCRMRFFYDTSESIASSTAEGYSYTSDANKKVYATVYNTDSSKWIVVKSPDIVANALPYGSIGLNPAVFANETGGSLLKTMSQKAITDAMNGADSLPYYEQYKGDAQTYTLGTANSIKKNKVINFGCDFSTFGTLNINLIFGTGNSVENKFAIDSTNLTRTVDGSVKPSVKHGITIQDHINVTIEIIMTGIKLTIVSNGQSFSTEYTYANGTVRPSYDVSGMTVSNVNFSWTSKDFKKDMWLFGDSYFSYGNNRWTYYLVQDGYAENCLIDGYPGEGSNYSLPSLQSYIDIAKPKNIVWCVGMNDGGDSSSAPSAQWKNAVDAVIAISEEKGINLILATIPTVPSINHEKKNEFVRSSGYQYIDFAKAVGASSSGVWFDGMLATDNVHPTVAGAMALYRQALLDCPQLMISN